MADYLTAVWNGFNVGAQDAELYVDKLAAVADSTASDMGQLATAMSKVASAANSIGVDVDQLNGQIATVIATTRQAPESVGAAFKTIYARINDIKAGTEDAEVSLGTYSGKMAELGFNVLDATGHLRDTGDVIEEIGGKWENLTREQQINLAQTMAGQRQYNNLIALFDNWDKYLQSVNTSMNAQGTLNEKNDIYLESLEAHLQKLSTQAERTYDILFDESAVKGWADAFTGALSIFNDFIDGLGGGVNTFAYFGLSIANIFNKQIAQAVQGVGTEIQRLMANIDAFNTKSKVIEQIKSGLQTAWAGQGKHLGDTALTAQAEAAQKTLAVQKGLTAEQQKQAVQIQKQIGLETQKIEDLQRQQQEAKKTAQSLKEQLGYQELTAQQIQKKKEFLQEEHALTLQTKNILDKVDIALKTQVLTQQQKKNLAKQISDEQQNIVAIYQEQNKGAQDLEAKTEQFKVSLEKVQDYLRGGNTSVEDFKKAWNEVYGVVNKFSNNQSTAISQTETLLQKLGIDTSQLSAQHRKLLGIYQQENNVLAQQGKHTINLQNLVKGISAAGMALTSIGGGLSTALADGATAADKLNGTFTAVNGSVGALLSMIPGIGPALNIAWQGVTSIGKAILQATGLWDNFEDHFKTTKERVDELNQSISKVNQTDKTTNAQIANLQAVADQYQELSKKAGDYGINLSNLTQQEQDRYHQITNSFTEYNEAVIAGYDEQGNAIVRGQDALRDTIQVLKQAKIQADKAALGDKDSFLKGISARHAEENDERYNVLNKEQEQVELDFADKFSEGLGQAGLSTIRGSLDTFVSDFAQVYADTESKLQYLDNLTLQQSSLLSEQFKQSYQKFIDDVNTAIESGDNKLLQQTLKQGSEYRNLLREATGDQNLLSQYDAIFEYLPTEQDVQDYLNRIEQIQENRKKLDEQIANQTYSQEDANALLAGLRVYDNETWSTIEDNLKQMGIGTGAFIKKLSEIITEQNISTDINEIYDLIQGEAENYAQILISYGDAISKAEQGASKDVEKILSSDDQSVGAVKQAIIDSIQKNFLSDETIQSLLKDQKYKGFLESLIESIYNLNNFETEIDSKGQAVVKTLETKGSEVVNNIIDAVIPKDIDEKVAIKRDEFSKKGSLVRDAITGGFINGFEDTETGELSSAGEVLSNGINNFLSSIDDLEKLEAIETAVQEQKPHIETLQDFIEFCNNVLNQSQIDENVNSFIENFDQILSIAEKLGQSKNLSMTDMVDLKEYLGLNDQELASLQESGDWLKTIIAQLNDTYASGSEERTKLVASAYSSVSDLKDALNEGTIVWSEYRDAWASVFDREMESLGIDLSTLKEYAEEKELVYDLNNKTAMQQLINAYAEQESIKKLSESAQTLNEKLKDGADIKKTDAQALQELANQYQTLTGESITIDNLITQLQLLGSATDRDITTVQQLIALLSGGLPEMSVQPPSTVETYQTDKTNLENLQGASESLSSGKDLTQDQSAALSDAVSKHQQLRTLLQDQNTSTNELAEAVNKVIQGDEKQLQITRQNALEQNDRSIKFAEFQKMLAEQAGNQELAAEQEKKINDLYAERAGLLQSIEDKKIDEDVDPESMEQLSKAIQKVAEETAQAEDSLKVYDKELAKNKKEADKVAQSILRFDDAIQDVSKNYDDWMEALTSDSLQDQAQVMDDLKDAYGDLLDIDGSQLSQQFLTSADNLDLMKAAIEGDVDAYDELLAKAGQDIITHMDLDTDQFYADLGVVQSELDNMNFQDLEIGANLDTGNFLQACTDLVNNAGMTAEQATAFLASMGIDAEVTEDTTNATEESETGAYTGEAVPVTGTVHFPTVSASSTDNGVAVQEGPPVDGTWQYDALQVTPDPEPIVANKQAKSFALKVTSANKSSGGDVKHKESTHGGGRSGGGGSGGRGSCFVAGTLVSTDEGFKNIEDIQIGDIVLSYNLKTLQNEYSEVLETMIHDTTENIYSIHIEDDIIESTGIHKFFIVRNKKMNWIPAQNLQIGDSVYFADGTLHKIQQIDIEERSLTVYNFEVSGNHNYYVGKNQILVHNKGKGSCFIAGTPVITEDGFKNIENIQKGDIVLSFNEVNNKNEYSEVLETMVHIVHENIYTLHIGNETLVVTGIHRFLITRNNIRSWVHAQDLQVGDLVQYADGTLHEIEQIDIKFDLRTVYNFEVSDNHNYYVGHNGILAHNKGKGKGGGGKGKTQKPDKSKKKKEKELKDEIDLYHDVDREIKNIDRDLSRLQKQQKKLEGPELQANLNKQLALLEKQVQKLREKQQIQLKDLEIRKQELKGLGLVFDEYGNIANYMVKVAEWQAKINELVRQYNALIEQYNKTTKKSQKEKLDKRIDAAKEKLDTARDEFEEWQKSVKEYEDLQDAFADTQDNILDINDQIDEIKNGADQAADQVKDAIDEVEEKWDELIEAFRRPIVFRLDMGEAERAWNQFRRQVLEHTNLMADPNIESIFADDRRNIRDIGSYFKIGEGIGTLEGLTKQLWATRDEIEAIKKSGSSAIYGPDKDRALEDLSSDLSELMGQLEDIQSLIDDIDQSYFDTVDDAQEHFNKQIDDYAYIRELIDHDIDLMKILYGDKNYDAMDRYYTTLEQNNNKNLEALRKQRDFWSQQWNEAVARGDTNAAAQFEQNYRNAISNLNSLISESVDNLKNKYENAINKIFDTLNNKVSGGKGLDYLSMEWELMTKNADEYLDAVNAAFAIQQTQSKYQKAIDGTKNIKNQQTLKKIMEEQLEILKNKEKITQYDVDRAQKLLEVEQARIALEDAQSAKTKLRLKRNAQGNYSYEYTADSSAVSDAQDKLATAQNALYNFDKDRYKSNLNDMLSAWNDFQAKYKEIILDMSLDEEERIERLTLLREQYGEYINGKTEQNLAIRNNLMDSAFQNIALIYKSDVDNYQRMADDEKQIFMEGLVPMWNSGIQQMSEKIVGQGGFLPTCDQAFKEITESTRAYRDELDDMADAAGIDLKQVKGGVDELAKSFEALIEDNDALISRMKDEIDAVTQLRKEAERLIQTYQGVYDAAMQAVKGIHNYLQAEKEKAAAQQAAAEAAASSQSESNESSSGTATNESSNGQATTYSEEQIAQALKDIKNLQDSLAIKDNIIAGLQQDIDKAEYDLNYKDLTKKQKKQLKADIKTAKEAIEDNKKRKKEIQDEINGIKQKYGFDTGGYTGEWNSNEGRLAILHEKELVLNENDTKNFLDGISILREITSSLNGNMFSMLDNLSVLKGFNPSSETIEQNVHIDANFPNVDSKREIEEAFNELVNMAAQRAMRK